MRLSVTTAKSGRINIFADGEYRFTVPSDVWYSHSFHDGDEITEADLNELKKDGGLQLAYESAMRMLSLRSHSKNELKRKLNEKYSPEEVGSALKKCEDYGFINDFRFAENYARELFEYKHFAPARIKTELLKKGVGRDEIAAALESLSENEDLDGGLNAALEKLHLAYPLTEKDRQRVYRRLLGMGYSYGEIKRILEKNRQSASEENAE